MGKPTTFSIESVLESPGVHVTGPPSIIKRLPKLLDRWRYLYLLWDKLWRKMSPFQLFTASFVEIVVVYIQIYQLGFIEQ